MVDLDDLELPARLRLALQQHVPAEEPASREMIEAFTELMGDRWRLRLRSDPQVRRSYSVSERLARKAPDPVADGWILDLRQDHREQRPGRRTRMATPVVFGTGIALLPDGSAWLADQPFSSDTDGRFRRFRLPHPHWRIHHPAKRSQVGFYSLARVLALHDLQVRWLCRDPRLEVAAPALQALWRDDEQRQRRRVAPRNSGQEPTCSTRCDPSDVCLLRADGRLRRQRGPSPRSKEAGGATARDHQ
jgi:hypothetical protein